MAERQLDIQQTRFRSRTEWIGVNASGTSSTFFAHIGDRNSDTNEVHIGSDEEQVQEDSIEQMFGEAMQGAVSRQDSEPRGSTEARATHDGRHAADVDVQMHDDMPRGLVHSSLRGSHTGETCQCNRRYRLRRKTAFCCG